ncbi:MAG: hypothetical protein NTX33_19875 [Propionibacteriales bacterium]|nr:hypothetical protein [Propionibacteriales bacterium]
MTTRKPKGEPMAGGSGIGVSRNRVFRCSDELWDAAKAKADQNGEKVADVIREALVMYVGDPSMPVMAERKS